MALWFLLKAAASLLAVCFMLRAYLQFAKLHPMNPLSQVVFRITDWLSIPMRRLFPPNAKTDWGSLFAAVLVSLALATFRFLMVSLDPELVSSGPVVRPFGLVLIIALVWLVGWWLKFLIVLVIAEALLSWFSKNTTAAALRPVLRLLLRPLIEPIARRMPERQPWGLDFSPIIAFLILQVLVSFQASLEASVLKALLAAA